MDSFSKYTFVLSGLLSVFLNTCSILPKLIGGSTLYLGKDQTSFSPSFFFLIMWMLPYLAHLPFKAHDSHFNQEHKMFELQMLIERLTVLSDNSRSHQFKLGAKFTFEKGEIKCISSNHSFDFF